MDANAIIEMKKWW